MLETAVEKLIREKIDGNPDDGLTRVDDVFGQSFRAVFKNNPNIYQLFFKFTKKLKKYFPVSRAALIVKSTRDNKLKVLAVKGRKGARQGLVLSLPKRRSLLYNLSQKNSIFTANYSDIKLCNFIEKKILFDRKTCSMAVLPVRRDNNTIGMICLSSKLSYAFDMMQDGILDNVVNEFGDVLKDELIRLSV